MLAFREVVKRMEGYVPGEQPQEKGFIKLNTNENPYSPPPEVLKALREKVTPERLALYPPPLSDQLRFKLSEVYGVPSNQIIVGNGSDELLNIIFRAFLGYRSRVAYLYPTYTLYRTLATIQEAECLEIPFHEENFQELPSRFLAEEADLKIVCNPNSPTGTFIATKEIEKLLQASRCPIVLDEAYVDFAEENALPLLSKYPQLIIVRTLSKSFSLAGLRIGFLFAHPEVVEGLLKLKDSYNVNILSQIAGVAALEGLSQVRENIRKIKKTREWFSQALEDLGFQVLPSQANFVFVRKRSRESLEKVYQELKKRKILVRFFPEWKEWLRITIGKDQEMRVLLENLKDILSREWNKGD